MCGIAGLLTFGSPVDDWHDDVVRASARMARRGPDDSGLWSDGARCLLGFRRLSILDLSAAGHQPMTTEDGRHALVYNGELYNYREIRRTLEARGVRFRSTGDTEVVLQALALFGPAALESFNGMFALGFYDRARRQLLLARDHAAIKPLYVLDHRDGVFFSSQYDQILAHPWARGAAISEGALGLYARLGHLPPPFAAVEGSSAIEAGAWLTIDADGRRQRGRHFTYPQRPTADLSGAAAVEAVDAAISAAVRRQLVSDVPLGVLLSGGIDSPLVAAKARQATNAALPAFTLGTNDDASDESADAGRYAEALQLEHVVRRITPPDALALLDDVVLASSEPHDDYSLFPTALIAQVARERVKVVLAGDGGDDLFWGYPGRMIRPLAAGRTRSMRWWTAALRPPRREHGRLPAGLAHLARQTFVAPEDFSDVFPDVPALPAACTIFDFDSEDADAVATWIRWNEFTGHLAGVLQKVDRASMHYALEVRVPLLDREVVELSARVDWRTCVDVPRLIGKLPLRAALARHVPHQTIAKRGFEAPMGDWLRGALRPLVEDLVLSQREIVGLAFDRTKLRTVFQRHLDRQQDATWLLWRLLSLALWRDRHFRPSPAYA